jgi:hypothetical protein
MIKNLSKTDAYKIKTEDPLPDLPFRMLVTGPSGSGKSNYLVNLLTRDDLLKSYFTDTVDGKERMDRMYIFSPSLHLNDDWKDVPTKHKFQPETFAEVEKRLMTILTKQEKNIKQHGKKAVYHLLILLDDSAAMSGFHESKVLQTFFFRGRHCLISIVLTSQSYKALPKKVRANCSHWVLFRPQSMAEADELANDLVRKQSQRKVADLFQQIWTVNYQFIYIQNELADITKRYMVNMETYIDIHGEKSDKEKQI